MMTNAARGAWLYGLVMLVLCAGCAGIASVITFAVTGVPAPRMFLVVGTILCAISGVPIAALAGSIVYPHQKEQKQ